MVSIKNNATILDRLVIPFILFVTIIIFWSFLWINYIKLVPMYSGEIVALEKANLKNMWVLTDYGRYFRYSPTGILGFGMLDRDLIAPALGIHFPSEDFLSAIRFVPIYILSFGVLSLLIYRFCRLLRLDILPSLIASFYFGINKGLSYSFKFASIIAVSFFIIYCICTLFFWTEFYFKKKKIYLIGYYVSFLLMVGAWEQWVNFLVFIILFSLILMINKKDFDRTIILNGIIIPLIIFVIYFTFRLNSIKVESSLVSEAQYVFSYPTIPLMVEDIIVNISHHIADVVDSAIIPWPLLSQAVIHNYDMDQYNPYNKSYTPYSSAHYITFTDWYSGLILGIFLCSGILLIRYLWINKKDLYIGLMGLLLTCCGFIAHLPIMYRTYFTLPGYADLMGYKHYISILGFSILVGWFFQKIKERVREKKQPIIDDPSNNGIMKREFGKLSFYRNRKMLTTLLSPEIVSNGLMIFFLIWIIFTNSNKLIISYQIAAGVFP